jgi:hypothetical protein
MVIRESKGCEYDADNIWKIFLNKETKMAEKVYVDKFRGSKAKYPIYVTPHFEYCRLVERENSTNGNHQ